MENSILEIMEETLLFANYSFVWVRDCLALFLLIRHTETPSLATSLTSNIFL